MEDCEPMFNSEPSSSAIRARPLIWVLTRSSQSTTDLADAVTVFKPRAMLTSGITRVTSPAREPACGAPTITAGAAMHTERSNVGARAYGNFIGATWANDEIRCYGNHLNCQ